MSDSSYLSIKEPASAEIVVSRSRFLGFAAPANSTDEVQLYIKNISSKYPDATHCCWAYKTGFPNSPQEHSSDAGEPSGTAGRPILGVISHFNLQNVIIIVVRYYGGTKLGIRGLIDAYSSTARATIERAEIILKKQMKTISVRVPYSIFDTINHHVRAIGGTISEPKFEQDIFCEISVPAENCQDFVNELRSKGARLYN